ncbi:hypothetical protein [Lactobacillus acetotolerans]|jgi:hypothetical protein|uniref:hypothetical protein n=1 Tax=Lactobacillus acetotolerans TaxID=1600 RepID=UPI002FE0C578
MAKNKNDNGGCCGVIAGAVIIGLIFSGISSCSHNLFGGGNNQPKTHKVEKKHKRKKSNLNISLYSQYFEVAKKISLMSNKTVNTNGCQCTIVKAEQLPLKDSTGFAYDKNHSAKFETNCLYRIWVKVQVPADCDAKLGSPTLDVKGGPVKSYTGENEFNTPGQTAEYANAEYLFGNRNYKDKTVTLHVPVKATKNGQTVKSFVWTTKFNLK